MLKGPKYQRGFWGQVIGAIAGALIARNSAKKQAERNEAAQREFAQQGIQWRVDDAAKAGVSPLYALGGSGAAFSPNPITVDPLAEAMGQAGQAYDRRETAEQRAARVVGLEAAAQAVKTDKALEQKYLAEAAIAKQRLNQVASPPASAFDPHWPGVQMYPVPPVKPISADQLPIIPGEPSRSPAVQPGLERITFPDFQLDAASPIQMDERLGEVGQALLLPYLFGHNIRSWLADQYEKLFPLPYDAKRKSDRFARELKRHAPRFSQW